MKKILWIAAWLLWSGFMSAGRVHAAEPAVCDTVWMTWTAEAGEAKVFTVGEEHRGSVSEAVWVDFGDGTRGVYSGDVAIEKTYAEGGSYRVAVAATAPEVRIIQFDCCRGWSQNHGVTSLDVSGCSALTGLYCNNNQLSSLDVSGCSALERLECNNNNQLSSLDVSKNTALTVLWCNGNQLSSLDVSKNTALVELWCNNNQLSLLDVSGCSALERLECNNNQLSSLDVSKNTALTVLWCDNNQLSSLDVSKNTALTVLLCDNNQLSSLDVSKNTALTVLLCDNNQLSSLDVSRNVALGELWCNDNQLSSLDVSKNTALMVLLCFNNQLSSLDVSKNTALVELWCNNNQLSSLDVSKNTALVELKCSVNQLSSLDVSQNPALYHLSCAINQLTSLDVSQNTALTELRCNNNQLTSLDVSQNAALEDLMCFHNHLYSLDICSGVKILWAQHNEMSLQEVAILTEKIKRIPHGHIIYGMSPQRLSKTLNVGEELDLSAELLNISGVETKMEVSDSVGHELSFGYNQENGKLVFSKAGRYIVFLSNDSLISNYSKDTADDIWMFFEIYSPIQVYYDITVTGAPTDPTVPSDTLVPENGAGWIWLASAGEEKEVAFKGTGKGFRVDWGDGSVSEAKGGAAPASAPASKDSEKELTHRYAAEGIYMVQLMPLSQNGRLTDLEVSDERVLSLAFSDASMLETLDCSDNLLAALDLSGCAALQEADFSGNRLTSVALPTHASLKDVEGEDNRLCLSTLYDLLSGRVKNASYEFDPQSDSVSVAENAVFDLASEMTIGGRATTYTLIDAATRRPAPADDYAAEGGLFRFSKPGARYLLTLRNANVTDYENGRTDDVVTFTWHICVSGVGNEDLASDGAAVAPWAYAQGRTIYLTEPAGGADLGEVEAFTAVGQRVYRGHDRAFSVPTAGVYVLRAADGRRCKVMVR